MTYTCTDRAGGGGGTETPLAGPAQSPGGDQWEKAPENSGNTAFYDAEDCPENHS